MKEVVKVKRNFIYVPFIGFIEAGDTIDDAIDRINRAEVKKEIEDKKKRRQLEKENPGCKVERWGNTWAIIPKDINFDYE